MKMTLTLVYFTSLPILQIFYVAGVSVSWSSPSTTYSSISSQSVPTYNGNLQQESMSSTIQPFRIKGGTLTNQIDNLNTKMSSNIGLGQDSNTIFAKQVGQQGDDNNASKSENLITNIQPSKMNFGSSLATTALPNFEIPIHINGPGLSNIYHETSKMSDMSSLNEVNKLLDGSSSSDEGFQLGEFGGLSESISEDGLNLVNSLGELNELNENGLRKEYSGEIGESETHGIGKEDNYRRGHKSKKYNLGGGSGGSAEFSLGSRKGEKQGFIGEGGTIEFGELRRNRGGRMFIENGEDKEEGRDRGFSGSVGSIQFDRINGGRADGSAGKEEGDSGYSKSNGAIRFGRKNKSGTGGLDGKEGGNIGFGKQNGFMRFGSRRKNGEGLSIRGEGGDGGFSRSNGSIRFSGKYKSGTSGLGGEEGGDVEIGRSNGSIRFGRKKKGREGRSYGEEEESKGFSGSIGSISLGRKKKNGTGGSGGENIKISEGRRGYRTSISRGFGRVNVNGGKRTFGGSIGGITFGEQSGGDKGLSKSNSININRTVGNNGGGRFDGYIEGNGFSKGYSTGRESDRGAFGEFGPEMGEKLEWVN